MMMQSPEARQYDEVHTPDSGGKRKFGVRRRTFGGDKETRSVENARDGRASETEPFKRARMSAGGRKGTSTPEFDFGSPTRETRAESQNGRGGGSGKYTQPARKVITPGASIVAKNEEEQRLRQLKLPPTNVSDFEKNIMSRRKATQAPGKPQSVPQRPKKRAGGSLESASAPTPSTTTAMRRDRWTPPVRLQRNDQPVQPSKRNRVELTPRRTEPRSAPSSSAARTSLRIQNRSPRKTFGIYDGDGSPPRNVVSSRDTKTELSRLPRARVASPLLGLRRSSRHSVKTKEGTEDMPIHLSDSEEDNDEGSNSSIQLDRVAESEHLTDAVNEDNLELEAVREGLLVDMLAHRVWFGEFAVRMDIYFCEEDIWLCSIRGVEREWPFSKHYRIPLVKVKRARIYRWDKSQASVFDQEDPAGKIMATISFLALQFPIPEVMMKNEWREFYNPSDSESSPKAYFIVAARDEDRDGTAFGAVEDVARTRSIDVKLLNTLEDVRPFTVAMIRHDHHYLFHSRPHSEARRLRRRKEAGDDMDATQLTYPLPPCTTDLVTITRQDISRLRPGEYLNDNIIDYYLKRLLLEDFASNHSLKRNVLFLSSHFYSRLRAGQGCSMKERLAAGYKNVSTWLTRSDLFNRTLVFVPINKDLHWSLAVIVNPSCAGEVADDAESSKPQTCIALLDPLGSYHSSIPIVRHLKSFLEFEWERTFGTDSYQQNQVSKIQVPAPLQSNSFDCGVYILKYAEEILSNFSRVLADNGDMKSPTFLLPRAITDDKLTSLISHEAFSARDVTNKRTELQELLAADTKAYEAIFEAKSETKLNS